MQSLDFQSLLRLILDSDLPDDMLQKVLAQNDIGIIDMDIIIGYNKSQKLLA